MSSSKVKFKTHPPLQNRAAGFYSLTNAPSAMIPARLVLTISRGFMRARSQR
jgi:hypothetical protein